MAAPVGVAAPAAVQPRTAEDADGDPRRGRGRDGSRDPEIRRSALEVLAEVGYDRLTMDAVAARARAGKATLYRRWPSKAELIVDAVSCAGRHDQSRPPFPDTGSLRGDLHALPGKPTEPGDLDMRIMTGLVSALPHHPDLAAAFHRQLIGPRVAELRRLFERAVGRGEIHPDRDLDLLAQLVPAMVVYRVLIMTQPPDEAFTARLIDELVLPLARARPDDR